MYNTLKMDEKSLNLHITMIQSNIYCSFFIILLHVLYLFFSIATYEKCLDQQHTKPWGFHLCKPESAYKNYYSIN
jgi:hypothetical protein